MTSAMMDISQHKEEENCDSPSGSSTSEPHEPMSQPSFIDSSFFYKLDQLSPDNPLFFMNQQSSNIQQLLSQQQQSRYVSPSLSPPPSTSSHHPNFVDPLLPSNSSSTSTNNPTFWSGFNNAIPNLAEYILGPSTSNTTNTPSNLPGMQIRVLGVPQTGAKSRVETQIKLCIQLVTDDGDKASWWSHLKLPEYMVAKDKLKRSVAPIAPEKMLYLTARVICASDPNRKVVTCLGCIQRERKRSQRRKEHKLKDEHEDEFSLEEQKVLLFNCSELVDFSSGDTILPTRITCYCRHHNERLGFCIYFEMHDVNGKQIATGMSPPIMITDDHKSNKLKAGRKRLRIDEQPQQQPQLNNYTLQPRPPVTPMDSPPIREISPMPMAITPTPAAQTERPLLQRLIPNEGPTFGGVEVTILGSGFRSGLTCMFGDVAASSTHYWSPNTLVCILPPATDPGTVVVSFKEFPLVVDSQDVTLFTYYNENDRALMELALQVVGLKMTGKVEDARDIAMRIVQGGTAGSNTSTPTPDNQGKQQVMSLQNHIIQVLNVMTTFQEVDSADISIASAQGHTMLHLAAMLGFDQLSSRLIDLGCDTNLTDKNGYTALHYAAWYNHLAVVQVLLKGAADPEISNMWNKKPLHLTQDTVIKTTLWNHIEEDESYGYSTDIMSADVDTSFAEESESEAESVWLSDHNEELDHHWQIDNSYTTSSDSEQEEEEEGLRHRRPFRQNIQYLNQEESTSHSTDEIMDAEPLGDVCDTDYEDNPAKLNWMQRTLSHFPPDGILQNIKNNMPAKPTELNLKNIADHLLQFPRPALNALFNSEEEKKDDRTQQPDQTLAWYMALAYAMGARSLTEEEEQTKFEFNNYAESSTTMVEAAKKRRDKRLFSFWVPMLCLMVIWLIYQFVSSHPGMVDTIIGISGFRRQYLTIH